MLISYVDYEMDDWEALKSANDDFKTNESKACVENNLCMIGIFGLKDPLRPGIRQAVETCHKAGSQKQEEM